MVWHFNGATGDFHLGLTDAILAIVFLLILYLLYAAGSLG